MKLFMLRKKSCNTYLPTVLLQQMSRVTTGQHFPSRIRLLCPSQSLLKITIKAIQWILR